MMKKYEKPAVMAIEIQTEVMILLKTSTSVLPGEDDDYADINSGIILPNGSAWD